MERVVLPCPYPWTDLTAVWMWHLGTQVGGGLGSAERMAGLGVLRGLSQPKQF